MNNSFSTMFASVDVVEQVLQDFQDAWRCGNPPPLKQFFDRLRDESPQVQESVQLLLVLQDQTLRWQMWRRQREAMRDTDACLESTTEPSGRAPLLEDYVRHCSVDGGLDTLPAELIAHEFRLRAECGDEPTIEEYQQRFPRFGQTLVTLLLTTSSVADPQKTVSKDDAPTVVETPTLPRSTPATPLETTVPMTAEEQPRRRKTDTQPNANFGQYEFLNEIARGAMGVVYRARHVTIDKIVALKLILSGQFASERQVDQFLREAQNAGRLEHDNIVRIYDAGKINDQYYIAMAYIEGQSLSDLVRDKSLSAQRAAEITESVARALHFAHVQPQPVYHRDIKPANVLLDQSGRAYVTDFGIAKRVEREGSTETGDDDIAGTPSYMPPEQTFGRDIGPWSDVYSTGALLYHLLTGKPPFLGESLLETIRQVRQVEPLPPSELNPKVDPDLEAVCLKCLEKDRTKRYLSAESLADDLRRFLNHEPTQARPISQLRRFAKWCHRNPVIANMAAVIVMMLATVAVTAVFVAREQTQLATIARDNEKLAKDNEQKEIAQRKIANEKKLEAEEKKKEADVQRGIAEVEKREADAQRKIANDKKLEAEEKKREADIQRGVAEKEKKEADDQRKKAQAARELAEQNLQKAIDTVNVILTKSAESGLKDVPGMEEFRKQVAQDALAQLEPILKANANQTEAMEARAKVFVVQAKLFDLTGQGDQAEKVFEAAIREFNRLSESGAGSAKYSLEIMAAYRQWGDSLADRAKVDQSTADRPLDSTAEKLLDLALDKYADALEVAKKNPHLENRLFEIELARTYQSRSNTLIYLRRPQEAVKSLATAIDGLRRVISKPGEGQVDAERRLGNCLHSLYAQDALLPKTKEIGETEYRDWLSKLNQAKGIHQQLHQSHSGSAEIQFDLARTCYSRARVLAGLAKLTNEDPLYVEAFEELATAAGLLSHLSSNFRFTPTYEFHRIGAVHLQALILVERRPTVAAALKFQEAERGIRAFNQNFPAARQENMRLRIGRANLELRIDLMRTADVSVRQLAADWLKKDFRDLQNTSELELLVDLLRTPDVSVRQLTAGWLKESFRDLGNASDPVVAREARALQPVTERIAAAVLAEQRNDLQLWATEMKATEFALLEYGTAVPDCTDFSERLRIKLCGETLRIAGEFAQKGNLAAFTATREWLPNALKVLQKSQNREVSENATEILKKLTSVLAGKP